MADQRIAWLAVPRGELRMAAVRLNCVSLCATCAPMCRLLYILYSGKVAKCRVPSSHGKARGLEAYKCLRL